MTRALPLLALSFLAAGALGVSPVRASTLHSVTANDAGDKGRYSIVIPDPQDPVVETPEMRLALSLPETEKLTLNLPRTGGSADKAAVVTNAGPALHLSLPVEEGNYRVRIHAAEGAGRIVVRAENRRLMAVVDHPGQEPVTCIVNVRNLHLLPPPQYAPGGDAVQTRDDEDKLPTWDNELSLDITGDVLQLQRIEIEPADVPTVFLVGDSTVTDQGGGDYGSWGQILPFFLEPEVSVANHARSGETLKSFIASLRLDKVLSLVKPGDYLFIQFGHNDQKQNWPQTYVEPFTTYKAYLAAYIAEARRRGVQPVLVTSMHRWKMDEAGQIVDTHGDYSVAVRQVAEELDVPLIDLHAMSESLYEALGPQRLKSAFANGGEDHTHQSQYGGYLLARCIINGIRQLQLPLAEAVREDVPPFDPAQPGDAGSFLIVP